ncbi:hypothetical protein ACPDHQ_07395 [Myroides odoratimimus]|uniref:hypothetical protein n=1 Tax=Myroides odoratimimus TaxID=76832 RepID=UPI003D2F5C9A
MKQMFVLLVCLIVVGCGSRKVEKHSKSVIEEVKTEEIEQIQTKELTLSKEQYSNLVHKLNVRADSIKTDAKGNTTLYNPIIESDKEEIKTDLDTSKLVDINTNKSMVEDSFKEDDEKDKNVKKEQFNWWGVFIPLGVILLVLYLVNRFLNNKNNLLLGK